MLLGDAGWVTLVGHGGGQRRKHTQQRLRTAEAHTDRLAAAAAAAATAAASSVAAADAAAERLRLADRDRAVAQADAAAAHQAAHRSQSLVCLFVSALCLSLFLLSAFLCLCCLPFLVSAVCLSLFLLGRVCCP